MRHNRPLTLRAGGALAAFATAAVLSTAASAAPVSWTTGEGGNGHSYDVILDNAISWDGARAAAQAAGGDLATISSQAEQGFVESVLSSNNAPTGSYWFGIRETATEGVYQHVNGQALSYTHWAPGQPDNSQGAESVGAVLWTAATTNGAASDAAALARRGGWNDAPVQGYPIAGLLTPPADALRGGYLVEFDASAGGTGNDDGGGTTQVPLPAAAIAFPVGAAFAGVFYRRMRKVA